VKVEEGEGACHNTSNTGSYILNGTYGHQILHVRVLSFHT